MNRLRPSLLGIVLLALAGVTSAEARPRQGAAAAGPPQAAAAGPTQRGKASYYHARFNGRRMANGQRFDPNASIAAHKSLPLGTLVRVTNLDNGRSAVVRVVDRGPYVPGRIIDLAPSVVTVVLTSHCETPR